MSARADMHRHFTAISPSTGPFARLTGNRWNGSHVNSMAWPAEGRRHRLWRRRYVLLMFEMIPNLSLTCVDTTPAMLEQVDGLLRANGIDGFETRQSTAECLELEPSGYDFVSSFNAVHHFDFPEFLRRSRDGLAKDGRLFVYTRLPEHNARSIWGRYFPGFAERRRDCWRSGISTGDRGYPGAPFRRCGMFEISPANSSRAPRRAGQEPALFDVCPLRTGRIRRRIGDLPVGRRTSLYRFRRMVRREYPHPGGAR